MGSLAYKTPAEEEVPLADNSGPVAPLVPSKMALVFLGSGGEQSPSLSQKAYLLNAEGEVQRTAEGGEQEILDIMNQCQLQVLFVFQGEVTDPEADSSLSRANTLLLEADSLDDCSVYLGGEFTEEDLKVLQGLMPKGQVRIPTKTLIYGGDGEILPQGGHTDLSAWGLSINSRNELSVEQLKAEALAQLPENLPGEVKNDLATFWAKIEVVSKQFFRKLRTQVRENRPNPVRPQVQHIDWDALGEENPWPHRLACLRYSTTAVPGLLALLMLLNHLSFFSPHEESSTIESPVQTQAPLELEEAPSEPKPQAKKKTPARTEEERTRSKILNGLTGNR
jgi:hypothetical protein